MKRFLFGLLMAGLIAALSGCADANGLHNQEAALVTFEFINFPESIDGDYSIPGNFDSWDNATTDVVMSKGSGTSSAIAIGQSNIQFTLVETDSWDRKWFNVGYAGNGADGSSGMRNFYIDGLDLSAGELTIVIDASSVTNITPVVE